MSRIEFHPEALLELEETQAWYGERDLLLAPHLAQKSFAPSLRSQIILIGFQGLAVMNTA